MLPDRASSPSFNLNLPDDFPVFRRHIELLRRGMVYFDETSKPFDKKSFRNVQDHFTKRQICNDIISINAYLGKSGYPDAYEKNMVEISISENGAFRVFVFLFQKTHTITTWIFLCEHRFLNLSGRESVGF